MFYVVNEEENRDLKIGIITINDNNNYGNRLQNYATQEVLRSLGGEVETVVNIPISINKQDGNKIKALFEKIRKKSFTELFVAVACKVKNILLSKYNKKIIDKRFKAFKQFTKDNIVETQFVISRDNIPGNLADTYDYFISGSDQVWNPQFRMCSPVDFLTFAPESKRVAYAASFGISSIPIECIDDYKKWLSEMEYLSVREESGADIIKELTGRNAIVLVDPTMMLSKDKWLSISKPAKGKPDKEYLLTYFLGGISKESIKLINQIASENQLEIVRLASIKDKNRFVAGPSEFIDFINSAKIVLTDSFHGIVFSILFEKPFIIFDRVHDGPSMHSRIETIIAKFHLQSRRCCNINEMDKDKYINMDYSKITPVLEFERDKALKYLKGALFVKCDN